MSGKLVIAGAGTGKTTKIIKEALSKEGRVLILTYTQKNEEQIRNRIKKEKGIIPSNIYISTWFKFLLKDGVRPYQGKRVEKRIENIFFPKEKNKSKYEYMKYLLKSDNSHYLVKNKIHVDRVSDFVFHLNEDDNKIVKRIENIYDYIYVDEVQDMIGWDLELLKKFIESTIDVTMVGDPRQVTYSTHNTTKNKSNKGIGLIEYFKKICEIDKSTLSLSYRNNKIICEFANRIYPKFSPLRYIEREIDDTMGIMLIDKKDIEKYLGKYNAVQLRHDKRKAINEDYEYYNFGKSKGLEFDSVLIYPTKDMWNWIIDNSTNLEEITKSKLYVAITRARHRVVIVKQDNRECNLPTITIN